MVNQENASSLSAQIGVVPRTASEEWDDEKLSFEILKEGNIPESYLENPKKLEYAVKLICDYEKYSDKHLYEKFEKRRFPVFGIYALC